jgi:hypothetical protein
MLVGGHFAIKGFWTLWYNIYECVTTVVMVMISRNIGTYGKTFDCVITTLAFPSFLTGNLMVFTHQMFPDFL